jgi:hypothetical protein
MPTDPKQYNARPLMMHNLYEHQIAFFTTSVDRPLPPLGASMEDENQKSMLLSQRRQIFK